MTELLHHITTQFDVTHKGEDSVVETRQQIYFPNNFSEKRKRSKHLQAAVFLTGWSIKENSPTMGKYAQEYANISQAPVHTIDTRVVKGAYGNLIERESQAVAQLIEDEDIKAVTILGHSRGATKGIHVATELKKSEADVEVKGLVFLNPVGLYSQDRASLIGRLAFDLLRMNGAADREVEKDKNGLLPRRKIHKKDYEKVHFQRTANGLRNEAFKTQLLEPNIFWIQRKIWETESCTKVNGEASQITAPVVIITGEHDPLSNPANIIPASRQEQKLTGKKYTMDGDRRREQLHQLFPNSDSVTLIVARHRGNHGLPALRPHSTAIVSFDTLRRYHRDTDLTKESIVYSKTG